MTVKIDTQGRNIFPAVEKLDVRDAGRNVELIFATDIDGELTPVSLHLSYGQANDLAILLDPFRKV